MKPMFAWRQAIFKSDLPPTTRHVLLNLSCHMTEMGEDCFPSIKLLCEETGLSNRTVITHLQIANDLGWITVSLRGLDGQKWKAHQYHPAYPLYLKKAVEQMEEAMNSARASGKKAVKEVHRVKKGGELGAKGGEPDAEKAVNLVQKVVNLSQEAVKEVHTSTSGSTSGSTSLRSTSETVAPDKSGAPEKNVPISTQVWNAYADAFFNRYRTEPIRNARANKNIVDLIARIGAQEAPHVAAFYVNSNNRYYIQKSHPVGLLLQDAEGLRTQWATGRAMTSGKAADLEGTSNNADSAREAMEIWKRRNGHANV